jgi:hypothetical protein
MLQRMQEQIEHMPLFLAGDVNYINQNEVKVSTNSYCFATNLEKEMNNNDKR